MDLNCKFFILGCPEHEELNKDREDHDQHWLSSTVDIQADLPALFAVIETISRTFSKDH